MRKAVFTILKVLLLAILVLPGFCLAGLKLEQKYPDIAGITGSSQSLNVSVAQTAKNAPNNVTSMVKYFTDLAAVLAIGLATLSLIIAGVQYLSSSGKPAALKAARGRAIKSFLGIAILVGSYLILQMFVPGIKIPELIPVGNFGSSNVLLISNAGLNEMNGKITKDLLDKLFQEGKIKYFGSQSPDLIQTLGQLIKRQNFDITFENFSFNYIGFYGKGQNKVQVKAFAGKNFLGAGHIYRTEGVANSNNNNGAFTKPAGWGTAGLGDNQITYFSLQTYDAKLSNVDYLDASTQQIQKATNANFDYPPLSILVEGVGAGVYLFGSTAPITVSNNQDPSVVGDVDTNTYTTTIQGKGGQRYLQNDIANFSQPGFDFDEQAVEINIKNTVGEGASKEKVDNILTFLFEDGFFKGGFRAFFAKGEKTDSCPVPVAKLYFESKQPWYNDEKIKISINDKDKVKDNPILNNFINGFTNGSPFDTQLIYIICNSQEGGKTIVKEMDQQGKIANGASSARIFHLADFDEKTKKYNSDCRAVALCDGDNLSGYCVVFTPQGKTSYYTKEMAIYLPMPWFTPIPLPKEWPAELSEAMFGDKQAQTDFKNESDFREVREAVESVGVLGNCAVALYENEVKNFKNCLNRENLDDCWEKKFPGKKSMVLSTSDMMYSQFEGGGGMKYINLKLYPIHSCVSPLGALGLSPMHSCVSSIAVYPLKNE